MKKLVLLLGIVALVSLLSACNLVNPVFTITCTTFNLTADRGVYTVDNTGRGVEQVFIRAYDGWGNQILNVDESSLVGADFNNIDEDYTFTTPPLANPIRVEFFSPAGFNLPVDTIWYTAIGSCAGLPDAIERAVFADGRINNRDAGAPFAIFKVGNEYQIYWVEGLETPVLELIVTADDIAAVADAPTENTLILSGDAHQLAVYRMADGRFHVRAQRANGKTYIVLFDSSGNYESLETD